MRLRSVVNPDLVGSVFCAGSRSGNFCEDPVLDPD
jgi:hypothetical protein